MNVQMSKRPVVDATVIKSIASPFSKPSSSGGVLLRLDRISRDFGTVKAVNDDVSFEMAPGELYAVIGPNGPGKTTFFSLISGLLAPTSGRVGFAGPYLRTWIALRFESESPLSRNCLHKHFAVLLSHSGILGSVRGFRPDIRGCRTDVFADAVGQGPVRSRRSPSRSACGVGRCPVPFRAKEDAIGATGRYARFCFSPRSKVRAFRRRCRAARGNHCLPP